MLSQTSGYLFGTSFMEYNLSHCRFCVTTDNPQQMRPAQIIKISGSTTARSAVVDSEASGKISPMHVTSRDF